MCRRAAILLLLLMVVPVRAQTAPKGVAPPRERLPLPPAREASEPASPVLRAPRPALTEPAKPVLTDPPKTNSIADLKQKLEELKAMRAKLDTDLETPVRDNPSTEPATSEELAKLKLRYLELLSRLTQAPAGPGRAVVPELQPGYPFEPGQGSQEPKKDRSGVVDVLALGHNLFALGDYEGALKAYQQVDLRGLKTEEWAPVKYMMASCYRRLNKLDQALVLYREVASAKGDPLVAECAQWQVTNLRARQELQNQLQNLRRGRQTLENQP